MNLRRLMLAAALVTAPAGTLMAVVVDGNKVAYRWTATARHVGELHGIPASGKDVEFSGIDIGRIEQGRLVEEWMNWDTLGLLRQLGAVGGNGMTGLR